MILSNFIKNVAQYIHNLQQSRSWQKIVMSKMSIEQIYNFYVNVINSATFKIKPQHITISIYFLERLIQLEQDQFTVYFPFYSCKLILLALLIVSCKIYEEYTVYTKDFKKCEDIAPRETILHAEIQILKSLDFRLAIDEGIYIVLSQRINAVN